jgi:hypothetical protein
VLGDTIERYMFISVERYGVDWMARPVVLILFAFAILGLVRPLLQDVARMGGARKMLTAVGMPSFRLSNLFTLFMIALLGAMMLEASEWNFGAKIVPLVVGGLALAFCLLSLLNDVFRRGTTTTDAADGASAPAKIHMDLASGVEHLPVPLVLRRAGLFFGWLLAFMASMAAIGLIPTVPLFVVAYMRIEAREPWRLVLPQALLLTLFIYIVFHWLLAIPWPPTLLGDVVPALKVIPSV